MFVITEKPTGVFNVIVNSQDGRWDARLPSVFVLALIVDRGDGRCDMLTSVRAFPQRSDDVESRKMVDRALSWLNLMFDQWRTGTLSHEELKPAFDSLGAWSKGQLRQFGVHPPHEVTRAKLDEIDAAFQDACNEYWESDHRGDGPLTEKSA